MIDTPTPTHEQVKAELEAARNAFAVNLTRWRRLNRWSQETPETWAQAADFCIVHNSQWSKLERGLTPQPGPLIFRGLGALNHRIATQNWGSGIPRSLLDRLTESKPICHPDGEPWKAEDFYASFIGRLEWPALPASPRRLTSAEAEAWSHQFQVWFDQSIQEAGQTPLEALTGLMDHVPAENQSSMQQAVLGMGGFSAAQLQRLSDGAGMAPEQWIRNWRQSLGLGDKLELSRHWRFAQGD